MEQVLLFILLGLGSGALIAGIAVGVVVTYRGSGIINLAIGGYAMLAGYAFWASATARVHALEGAGADRRRSCRLVVVAIESAFRPLRTARRWGRWCARWVCC